MEHKDKPSGIMSDVESDFAREARIVVEAHDLDPDVRESRRAAGIQPGR